VSTALAKNKMGVNMEKSVTEETSKCFEAKSENSEKWGAVFIFLILFL
jgi:hypothetical protein